MRKAQRALWKLISFITRYSSTSLAEVRELTIREAETYAESLSEIVQEENRPPSASGR